jgi:hypothetical protein
MLLVALIAAAFVLFPFAVYRYGTRGPLNNPKFPAST